jgi:prepilin-type N-terminal cleavage/methylation domain-containing protein
VFQKLKFNSGFTLVEILIAVAVLGVLASSTVVIFTSFSQRQSVNIAFDNVKNALNEAKSNASSNVVKNCADSLDGYQISFTARAYTLQEVCRAPGGGGLSVADIKTTQMPGNTRIDNFPVTIKFRTLARDVDNPGHIDISYKGEIVATIQVDASGVISGAIK